MEERVQQVSDISETLVNESEKNIDQASNYLKDAEKMVKKRGRPAGSNPIDKHVGERVRISRTILGISRQALGEEMGLTVQQIQKYERGINRISAARLYLIAQALNTTVSSFYEGLPESANSGDSDASSGDNSNLFADDITGKVTAKRETLELIRAYYKIKDQIVRKRVLDLCRAVSE